MKNLQQNTYKITDNHLVTAKFQNLTPHIIDILTDIHDDVIKGKKKMIPKLIKLALKYPKVPQFKNHLSAVYKKLGNIEKSFETNKWLVTEHPNYLFGKLNLANEYIYKKEFNKVFEVLGENLDIHELYPERKEFHLDEIMSFYVTNIRYFLETGNEEQAQRCLYFLKEIDKNHPKIEDAEHFCACS